MAVNKKAYAKGVAGAEFGVEHAAPSGFGLPRGVAVEGDGLAGGAVDAVYEGGLLRASNGDGVAEVGLLADKDLVADACGTCVGAKVDVVASRAKKVCAVAFAVEDEGVADAA